MGFQDAIRSGFANYANFSDRSSRSEFWYWTLAVILLEIAFYIVIAIVPLAGILGLLFLGLIIPGLAVSVRRLHDVGKSGWLLLIVFIPFAGFYILYLYLKPSGLQNQYGRGPLTAADL